MITTRRNHTLALIPDNRLLIMGGHDGTKYLSSSEIYDISKGTFTQGPNMSTVRGHFSASTLLDGRVLACGGFDGQQTSEIYDIKTNTF